MPEFFFAISHFNKHKNLIFLQDAYILEVFSILEQWVFEKPFTGGKLKNELVFM